MKAHGTYYSATLMAFSGVQRIMGTGKLHAAIRGQGAARPSPIWGKGLNLAYRNGVKIALGTDSAVAPHSEANKELELMVSKGGMTPARRADRRDQGRPRPAWTSRTRPERSIPASRPT